MTLLERDREKIQEGREQGIEQGRHERELELAKALLDLLDDQTIAIKIGLSLDQVKQLRSEKQSQ